MTDTKTCAHCGSTCGDYDGGYATVKGHPVCHPNEPNRVDCYRLITVYGQRIGFLNLPKPGGCSVREIADDGRMVLCPDEAVHSGSFVDRGCPDDKTASPREIELLYCARHRHLAASSS